MWCHGPVGAHWGAFRPIGPRPQARTRSQKRGLGYCDKMQTASFKLQAASGTLEAASCKRQATSYKRQAANYKLQATSRAAAGCKPLISSAIQAEGQEPKRPNGQRGQQGQRPNKQHPLRCSWPKANRAKCPINNISYDVLRPNWSLAKGPTRPIGP